MRSLLSSAALMLVVTSNALRARDVYGNATPWTNSDTVIWEIHQKQNAFAGPSGGPSWQSQLAGLEAQRRLKAQDAARDAASARELAAWAAERKKNEKPLTWAQEMDRYIMQNGDRAAPEQEQMAFYYADQGDFKKAIRPLELVIFRKRPRAGEAAWQLYQIHSPGGFAPDPALAEKYLRLASELGDGSGLWKLAATRYQTDPAGAVPLLQTLLAGKDATLAARAGRLIVAHNLKTNDPARALVTSRQIIALSSRTNDLRLYDYSTLVDLLLQSGGWERNREELLALLRATPTDGDSLYALCRVYLGLDPAAAPWVKPDHEQANVYLSGLARRSRSSSELLLAQMLPPGPDQRLPPAARLLSELRAVHPDEPAFPLRSAAILCGEFGGEPDFPGALNLLEKLAERNDASPLIVSATARLVSRDLPGQPANPARAFALFQRAAEAGEPYAQYRFAEALLTGRGVAADPTRALEFLEEATRAPRPPAASYPLYTLCARALREIKVGDDDALRSAIAQASAPDRFPPAQLEHARALYAWAKVAAPDQVEDKHRIEAISLATLAANAGLAEARLLLAQFYREGFGTSVDLPAARSIYLDGANSGVAAAMSALADLQLSEKLSPASQTEGYRWAEKSAALGDPDGMYLAGRCHWEGRGVATNRERGRELIERAATAGHPAAETWVGNRILEASPILTADYTRAVSYLRHAAATGDLAAAVSLVQAVGKNPALTPDLLRQLNALIASGNNPPSNEEIVTQASADFEAAASRLETLTLQLKDPARAYETALWLRGEPSTFAPPMAVKYPWGELMQNAAQAGHPAAQFRGAVTELEKARDYLAKPEADARGTREWGVSYSDGHFSAALKWLRSSAAAGDSAALAYLKARSIPLQTAVEGDALDRAAIDRIKARIFP